MLLFLLFTIFHKDKVVLRPDPLFMSKVVPSFHLSQPTVLPVLCPSPSDSRERTLHSLDVRRALSFYLARTSAFRLDPHLFVTYGPPTPGRKVSSQRLAGWIKGTIGLCYQLARKPLPQLIRVHATRAVAASTALLHGVPLYEVYLVATWSSPSTFVTHYALDVRARRDASFGRAMLAAALS